MIASWIRYGSFLSPGTSLLLWLLSPLPLLFWPMEIKFLHGRGERHLTCRYTIYWLSKKHAFLELVLWEGCFDWVSTGLILPQLSSHWVTQIVVNPWWWTAIYPLWGWDSVLSLLWANWSFNIYLPLSLALDGFDLFGDGLSPSISCHILV